MVKIQQQPDPNGNNKAPALDEETERRLHQRADLPLKVRFLTDSGCEWTGMVTNISAGGAMIRAKYPPGFGQSVVLYIDQVGRIEGKVVRSESESFAVSYRRKRAKHAKLADELTTAMHTRHRKIDRRGSPRVKHDAPATVYLEDGRVIQCAILDISLTGASIEISPRPPLGMHLILGRMTAKVIRRHEKGVGVVFTGAADRMDEVIAQSGDEEPEPYSPPGPELARSFGKKGAR
ncbi:PilZ domain-containing protein [Hyphococcus flavus]|uniref:PilZ domain-containing protein n=1 Tax=Hyphococcus flavus TaxID=1866326 RepID=A0AAE9ZFA3_9PROT|nr:PilZ domain-containing protein [Hyphococcus flavus]WDI31652.1 PilZ domain-containing protein [Hyphococcus flavus]